MKNVFLFIALLFIISCVKKDADVASYSDKIVLNTPVVGKDSVSLTWSEFNNIAFKEYQVSRKLSPEDPGTIITSITNRQSTSFVDWDVPYSPYLAYSVAAVVNSGNSFKSNIEMVKLPEVTFTLKPLEIKSDTIMLSWEGSNLRRVQSYTIQSKSTINENWSLGHQTNNSYQTTFTDLLYPYGATISYRVIANFQGGAKIYSNIQEYTSPEFELKLEPLKIYGNDSIVLTWNTPRPVIGRPVNVIRKLGENDPNPLKESFNFDYPSKYVDKNIPYSPYINYQVTITPTIGKSYQSNTQVYSRPQIPALNLSAYDVKYDKDRKWLYVFERSTISIFDIQANKIIKSVNSGATHNYADFGYYNNVKELYVPRTDGWIFIYNALTLELIDQINVGINTFSVLSNSNILFASTNAWTQNPLKVYNRTTKTLVTQTGDQSNTVMRKIPGTNSEIIEISSSVSPVDQDYYEFDVTGNLIERKNDTYHGTYALDYILFEMFPSGNKYITSTSGAIYNTNMIYQGSLPVGNKVLTCVAFDDNLDEIYTGTRSKTIEVYSELSYTHKKTYQTDLIPYWIYKEGNKLLVVGSSLLSYQWNFETVKFITFQWIDI